MFHPGEYYFYDPANGRWWWSADRTAGHYWSLDEEAWQFLPGANGDPQSRSSGGRASGGKLW